MKHQNKPEEGAGTMQLKAGFSQTAVQGFFCLAV